MMNQQPDAASTTKNVEKPLQTLTIIWLVFFGNLALLLMLSELTKPSDFDGETGNLTIAYALLAASVASVAASFVVKRILLSKAAAARKLPAVQSAYIVAFAMCEACCLLGFLMRFLVVTNLHYILFGVGALALLLHKPRRDDFLNAAFGSNPSGTFQTTRLQ